VRTVGRRLPPGHTPGDFNAYCDICGVLWPRSKLRADRSGSLVCPDDREGLDEVALAEADARILERAAARRSRPKRSGRPQQPDSDLYENPVSIAGPANTFGWWLPEHGLAVASGRLRWRNSAPGLVDGDLAALGSSLPAVSSTNGVTFSSSTMLRSPSAQILRPVDELTVWLVATAGDEPVVGFQDFIQLGAFSTSGALMYGCGISRLKDGALGLDGEAYGTVSWASGDGSTSLLADRPDNVTPHIYRFVVTAEELTLSIDDDSYTGAPTSDLGFQDPLGAVAMGRNGNCTIHEAAVTSGAGVVNSEMKAYFRRRWPTIPALGVETTQAGVTI